MRRLGILTIVLALLQAFSAWGDLSKPKQIDRVYVHPDKKQAALALVANEALDTAAAKVAEKLNTYIGYTDSGQLYKDYPEVDRKLPVVISLTVMVPPANEKAKEFLDDTRRQLEKRGFEVWLMVYDPATKKLKRE